MRLYYITDRSQFPGDQAQKRRLLLAKIAEAAACGVHYIQLREKDLSTRELESLACQAMAAITGADSAQTQTRLLINSRPDVALAAGAAGVHLRANDIAPPDARKIWQLAADREFSSRTPILAVSCHTVAEVARAAQGKADFAVFAPVFEKAASPHRSATGLNALQSACASAIPVFALGGVSLANARLCMDAGAAGIAGIRLFQQHAIEPIVSALIR